MKEITMPKREDLYRDYILQKMTLEEIAKKYGVLSCQTVRKWMVKYNIPLRGRGGYQGFSRPTKDELKKMYLVDNMTADEIAEHFGASIPTVRIWLTKYNLAVKQENYICFMPEKEALRKMYLDDNMNVRDIAEHFHVSTSKIWNCLKYYGLTIKAANRRAMIPKKDVLYKMYIVEDMSATEIGERLSVSPRAVYRWLRDYGLTIKRQNSRHEVPSTADIDTEATETKA